MNAFLNDVRYGFRMLLKSPVVTGVAILSLAAAIAVNATTFATLDSFLFEPLPYPDQDALVFVWQDDPVRGSRGAGMAPAEFLEVRESATSFTSLAAWSQGTANLTGGEGDPEQVSLFTVTPGTFATLGVQPALGRDFRVEDAAGSAGGVVVLHHSFWARRFAADPAVLGRTVLLDDGAYTVIGVMPPDFEMIPADVDFFRPSDLTERRVEVEERNLLVAGRLAPSVTVARADEEMAALHGRFVGTRPELSGDWRTRVEPMRAFFPGPTDTRLLLILVAVTLFGLLIACANVANLLLARAETRQREMAVRAALGAGRHRILRQLLTESVIMALLAGTLGTVASLGLMRGFITAFPPEMPPTFWPRMDPVVLLVVLALTLGAGLAFGLAPALHGAGGDLRTALGEGGRGGTAGRTRRRLRDAFVVGEFAVALALLSGAVFLGGAFDEAISKDPGYETEGVLTFSLQLPASRYGDAEKTRRFHREVLNALEGIPGVAAVGLTSSLPRGRGHLFREIEIEGAPPAGPEDGLRTAAMAVSSGYFPALGVELREGRLLTPADRFDAPPVAAVNGAFAHRFFPGASPLGRRIVLDGASREIVGVVETVTQERLVDPERGPAPFAYLPYEQWPVGSTAVLLRATGDAASLTTPAREAVRSVDPDLPLGQVATLDHYVRAQLGGPRVVALFLTVVGAVALALAAMGIYGVLAQSVLQQTREIGIRMAMGAGSGRVLAMVTGNGLRLALVGMLLGTPLAWLMFVAVSRALAGVGRVPDPFSSFTGVAGALMAVAAVACGLPALRASRVAPTESLRAE